MPHELSWRKVLMRDGRDPRARLTGWPTKKRAGFLDRVLGASVFAKARLTSSHAVVRVRSDELDYVATLAGGGVEHFQKCLPDRTNAFAKAMARATRERDEAREAEATLAIYFATARLAPGELEPAALPLARLSTWRRFVFWLLTLFGRGPWKRRAVQDALRPPAASIDDGPTRVLPNTLLQITAAHRGAEARLLAAAEHVALLSTDRDRYADQRRESLFDALRELVDDLARGGEVVSMTIDVPLAEWPHGLVPLESPRPPRHGVEFAARLVVTDFDDDEASPFVNDDTPSASLFADAPWPRVVRRLERVQHKLRSRAATDATSRARDWIATAGVELTRKREGCVARIEALRTSAVDRPR